MRAISRLNIFFEATKKGIIFICRKKLCRKLGNISQKKCLEFRMDHDVVYLEMIQSGTDGDPILCPVVGLISYCWPCPILYDKTLFGKLFFRWCHPGFFCSQYLLKNRLGAWNIDETNKFQARVCDTQFRYDLFMPVFFFPVAMRIEITELNQDCNLWECCSACFQVASGSFWNQKWWWSIFSTLIEKQGV